MKMTWQHSVLSSGALCSPLVVLSGPSYATPCRAVVALHAISCAELTAPLPLERSWLAKDAPIKPSIPLPSFGYLEYVAQPSLELSPGLDHAATPPLVPLGEAASGFSHRAADLYAVEPGLEAGAPAGNPAMSSAAPEMAQESRSELLPPGVWERPELTGNWGGLRSQLADSGVTFDLYFTQFL